MTLASSVARAGLLSQAIASGNAAARTSAVLEVSKARNASTGAGVASANFILTAASSTTSFKASVAAGCDAIEGNSAVNASVLFCSTRREVTALSNTFDASGLFAANAAWMTSTGLAIVAAI